MNIFVALFISLLSLITTLEFFSCWIQGTLVLDCYCFAPSCCSNLVLIATLLPAGHNFFCVCPYILKHCIIIHMYYIGITPWYGLLTKTILIKIARYLNYFYYIITCSWTFVNNGSLIWLKKMTKILPKIFFSGSNYIKNIATWKKVIK